MPFPFALPFVWAGAKAGGSAAVAGGTAAGVGAAGAGVAAKGAAPYASEAAAGAGATAGVLALGDCSTEQNPSVKDD